MKKIKEFGKNFKSYVDYLMTVNFKELLVNVLILICIIILSLFVFIPVGIVQELIRSFIVVYASFSDLGLQIFNWIFLLISVICSVLLFGYLFNRRFSDIEKFKEQVKESLVKKDNKKNEVKKEEPENVATDDEIVLPKTKKK